MKRLQKYIHLNLLLVSIIFYSCANSDNEIPNNIIPQEKLVDVITEMEITQALVKFKFTIKDSSINQSELFKEIYIEYNISKEQISNSIKYYTNQPKTMDSIYVKVIDRLSEMQAKDQEVTPL